MKCTVNIKKYINFRRNSNVVYLGVKLMKEEKEEKNK